MTIATRNRFIRICTVISLLLAVASIVSIVLVFARGLLPATPPGYRPLAALDTFILTPYSPQATTAAIGIFPILSLAGLIYILFAFEKTQTVEITFFAACVFAVSLESIRLLIPLFALWINTNVFLVTISRFIFFSRIFTLLALLLSAIFATGNVVQQVGPIIFLLAFISFSLSNAIPINSGRISSVYLIATGYKETITLFFILLGILSILSYHILGKTRNVPEYSRAAVGIVLLLIGYALLAACDSWLFFIAGSALLLYGAVRFLKPVHQYYLWQ
jgi:hypothetical protein